MIETMQAAELVAQVGFPIAAYLLMHRLVHDTLKKQRKQFRKQSESFEELIDEIRRE
jgi:hypothetical protein